jgi:hypothetical protein
MERIYRKGFGFCLISHKSFQTHRIINRSSSVFSVRSVVNSAVFGLKHPRGVTIAKSRRNLELTHFTKGKSCSAASLSRRRKPRRKVLGRNADALVGISTS